MIISIYFCILYKVIVQYSVSEKIGLKDANSLDMPIKQPFQADKRKLNDITFNIKAQKIFGTELPTIYDKAAILVINLEKNIFFIFTMETNGQLLAMITFFKLNGCTTHFSQEEAVRFILDITTSSRI